MIDGIPLVDLGASALVGIVVILILTGRLVPRKHLDDAIDRANSWRETAKTWEATAGEALAQIAEMQESRHLQMDILRAIRELAEDRDR